MECSRKGRVDSLGKAHDEQATTAREPPVACTLGSPLESVGQSLTRDGRESEDNARPVSATPKVGLRWWNLARGRDGAGRGVSRGEWRPTRPTNGGPTAEDGLGLDDSRAAAHRSGQRRSTSFPLGKASGRPTGTTRPPRSLTVLSPRLRAPQDPPTTFQPASNHHHESGGLLSTSRAWNCLHQISTSIPTRSQPLGSPTRVPPLAPPTLLSYACCFPRCPLPLPLLSYACPHILARDLRFAPPTHSATHQPTNQLTN